MGIKAGRFRALRTKRKQPFQAQDRQEMLEELFKELSAWLKAWPGLGDPGRKVAT